MTLPGPIVVPKYSWWGFVFAASMLIGVCAWEAWRHYNQSGRVDALYPIIAVWGVSYLAHRWHSLRKEQVQGTFSAEQYRANPIGYFRGSFKLTALWVGILVVAILALAIYQVGTGTS